MDALANVFLLRTQISREAETLQRVRSNPGRAVLGYYINKLAAGATINSSRPWYSTINTAAYFEFFDTGEWQGGADAYVGLRIQNGANFNYGWAHLNYDDAHDLMTLKEFAYQTTANLAIAAGAVPEPASALLLALGACGAAELRRRRKSVAA